MDRPPQPRRAHLADGREIIYFDDAGSAAGAPAPDRRTLPGRGAPADLRHDPFVDEWGIVAAHRQERTHLPPARDCPLCPSRGDALTEIPEPDYDVVVFENRFPSLPAARPSEPATGRCEVVCYDSRHDASFAGLPASRLRTVGDAWAHRTEALSADPGIAQVFCFENRGEEIGVTLHHPHGQIYGYPFVPPRIERMLEVARRHGARGGACLGCEVLDREIEDGRRIVAENEHAVAYVPEAARWPFEVHLVPRRHVPDLAALGGEERDAAVMLQEDVLARLDRLFERPAPYMAGWLQAPTVDGRDELHLRLQVVSPRRAAGKLKYLAGSESLAGGWINDVRPEQAADRLRSAAGG